MAGLEALTEATIADAESFLQEQEIRPWQHMPAWMPGDALSFVSVKRAVDEWQSTQEVEKDADATWFANIQ